MRYTAALVFAIFIVSLTDASAQSRRYYSDPSREDCPQGRQIRTQKSYPATMSDCEVLDADTAAENQKMNHMRGSVSDGVKPPALSNRQPAARGQSEPQYAAIQTSCHMDSCFWFRMRSKATVKTGASGNLVEVLADRGESVQPEPSSGDKLQPIKWRTSPVESYFFCSKSKPASIDLIENKWVASLLAPGNPDSIPGSDRDSYILYLLICHGRDFSKQVVSDADVAAYGYSPNLVNLAGEQQKLGSPIDIMDDYRSISFDDFKLDGKDFELHPVPKTPS